MSKRSGNKLSSSQSKAPKVGPAGPPRYGLSPLTSYDSREMKPISNFFAVASSVPVIGFHSATPVIPEESKSVIEEEESQNESSDSNEMDNEEEPSSALEPPKPHAKAKSRAGRHDGRPPPKSKAFLSSRASRSLQSYIEERIRDFPDEPFENCGGQKLFCKACREDLGTIDRYDVIRRISFNQGAAPSQGWALFPTEVRLFS